MAVVEDEGRAERFLDRVDKRSVKKLRLKKDRLTVYLPPGMIETIDRNRFGLGFSRSAYIAYCIAKTAKPYDQARAERLQVEHA